MLKDNLNRNAVIEYLKSHKIATKPGIMCCHLETTYKKEPWKTYGDLSQSQRARDHSLILPIHNDLSYEEQKYIGDRIKFIIKTMM